MWKAVKKNGDNEFTLAEGESLSDVFNQAQENINIKPDDFFLVYSFDELGNYIY